MHARARTFPNKVGLSLIRSYLRQEWTCEFSAYCIWSNFSPLPNQMMEFGKSAHDHMHIYKLLNVYSLAIYENYYRIISVIRKCDRMQSASYCISRWCACCVSACVITIISQKSIRSVPNFDQSRFNVRLEMFMAMVWSDCRDFIMMKLTLYNINDIALSSIVLNINFSNCVDRAVIIDAQS